MTEEPLGSEVVLDVGAQKGIGAWVRRLRSLRSRDVQQGGESFRGQMEGDCTWG